MTLSCTHGDHELMGITWDYKKPSSVSRGITLATKNLRVRILRRSRHFAGWLPDDVGLHATWVGILSSFCWSCWLNPHFCWLNHPGGRITIFLCWTSIKHDFIWFHSFLCQTRVFWIRHFQGQVGIWCPVKPSKEPPIPLEDPKFYTSYRCTRRCSCQVFKGILSENVSTCANTHARMSVCLSLVGK